MHNPIALIDLAAQQAVMRDRIDAAIQKVLDHGKYILGPEVDEFEENLSAFTGASHVVTCANGTDALSLVLMAEEVGSGDAVFVPSFTFVATAEIIPQTGATPIMVDVEEDSFNIDPESLEAGIATAKNLGLKPKAVIPVDLFGLPAKHAEINKIAKREGMFVITDAAQSLGSEVNGVKTGNLTDYTTTSFFPAKPLGCYGDGGAILLASDEKAKLLRSLRFHGKGDDKYDNVRLGMNSRLDTIQAAVLNEKLTLFADELSARNNIAARYRELLSDSSIGHQVIAPGHVSAWAQYTIVVEDRAAVQDACAKADIATAVYYPLPMHLQTGYKNFPIAGNSLLVSEKLSKKALSLPMHPYLTSEQVEKITQIVSNAI